MVGWVCMCLLVCMCVYVYVPVRETLSIIYILIDSGRFLRTNLLTAARGSVAVLLLLLLRLHIF